MEDKTAEGIEPERKWLDVTIVFAKKPSIEEAYNSIYAETQKLANKGLDISLYVSVGNKNIKTSWKQLHDVDGSFVFANYDSTYKRLTKNEHVLKQYP
ncbi:hypothetical protein OQJ13_07970 [Legionella sp. PATHC035]|uniref:hypothetical protein n=1 Tax=Legionella sp. PATHC035 TaxID=2992040 RepID=UPI002244289F|nr:hypothetical protein [Legionella sp. PATHC035]MCW8408906.1 hypothetical protein [Legionella sp. PATHC035]